MSVGVPILLGKTKVDDVNLMIIIVYAYQEIGRFDVTVDEMTSGHAQYVRSEWFLDLV
jgi:hypothetical protein